MGYYVSESAGVEFPSAVTPAWTNADPAILPPKFDRKQADMRASKKMEIFDRTSGTGPKATETSIVGIRYEIRTAGGDLIDNNRKSNARNNELVSTSFKALMFFHRSPL